MELATVIISVIGLLFAAVAAWGAVTTVRLTREMQTEANVSRLLEALMDVEHGVASRTALPEGLGDEILRNAQRELMRAVVLPWVAPLISDKASEQIEYVINAQPGDREAWHAASLARMYLSTRPPPKLMPRWYLWIVDRLYGYRKPR